MVGRAIITGMAAAAAYGTWSAITMFSPVPYTAWDVGRGVIFVVFVVAMLVLATDVAQSGASFARTLMTVTLSVVTSAVLTLAIFAALTSFFVGSIVQLPDVMQEYTNHGYTSPKEYLDAHYWALQRLQAFSWAVTAIMMIGISSLVGWMLRDDGPKRRVATSKTS